MGNGKFGDGSFTPLGNENTAKELWMLEFFLQNWAWRESQAACFGFNFKTRRRVIDMTVKYNKYLNNKLHNGWILIIHFIAYRGPAHFLSSDLHVASTICK